MNQHFKMKQLSCKFPKLILWFTAAETQWNNQVNLALSDLNILFSLVLVLQAEC